MSVQALINGVWTDVADVAAPPGVVSMWPAAFVNSGGVFVGPNTGWLACNGQAVSRTLYAALFQAIGTIWGVGDGSTTFNLPDLQEAAPVGAGTSLRAEVTHDIFNLAQFKDDQEQGHIHPIGNAVHNGSGYYMPGGGGPITCDTSIIQATGDPTADSHGNGTPRTGIVTRGKRIGVNFIIKT
ncbi:MAG: phage tail protein [Spirochaetia bacterium]